MVNDASITPLEEKQLYEFLRKCVENYDKSVREIEERIEYFPEHIKKFVSDVIDEEVKNEVGHYEGLMLEVNFYFRKEDSEIFSLSERKRIKELESGWKEFFNMIIDKIVEDIMKKIKENAPRCIQLISSVNLFKIYKFFQDIGGENIHAEIKKETFYSKDFELGYLFIKDFLKIYNKFPKLFNLLSKSKGELFLFKKENKKENSELLVYLFTAGKLGEYGKDLRGKLSREAFKNYHISFEEHAYIYKRYGANYLSLEKPKLVNSEISNVLIIPALYFQFYEERSLFEWHVMLELRRILCAYGFNSFLLPNLSIKGLDESVEIDILCVMKFNDFYDFIVVECKTKAQSKDFYEFLEKMKKISKLITLEKIYGLLVTMDETGINLNEEGERFKILCATYSELKEKFIQLIFEIIKDELPKL